MPWGHRTQPRDNWPPSGASQTARALWSWGVKRPERTLLFSPLEPGKLVSAPSLTRFDFEAVPSRDPQAAVPAQPGKPMGSGPQAAETGPSPACWGRSYCFFLEEAGHQLLPFVLGFIVTGTEVKGHFQELRELPGSSGWGESAGKDEVGSQALGHHQGLSAARTQRGFQGGLQVARLQNLFAQNYFSQ